MRRRTVDLGFREPRVAVAHLATRTRDLVAGKSLLCRFAEHSIDRAAQLPLGSTLGDGTHGERGPAGAAGQIGPQIVRQAALFAYLVIEATVGVGAEDLERQTEREQLAPVRRHREERRQIELRQSGAA